MEHATPVMKKKRGGCQGNLLFTHKVGLQRGLGLALGMEGKCWDRFSSFKDEEKAWEEGWWTTNRKVDGWWYLSRTLMVGTCAGEMSGLYCIWLVPTGKWQCRSHRRIHQERKEGQEQCLQRWHFSQVQQPGCIFNPSTERSCLATALLLIQCLYPTWSFTLDHDYIAFLLHGFKQV